MVYGNFRSIIFSEITLNQELIPNERMQMKGLKLLGLLPEESIPVAFFDPQYRGILDRLE